MLNIIYNFLGMLMLIWYSCIRWTWYSDPLQYPWAYKPINMFTAFMSFIFLIPALFAFKQSLSLFMYCLAIFLVIRNAYYTIEDVVDYIKNPSKQQFIFIVIDVLMWIFVAIYLYEYNRIAG